MKLGLSIGYSKATMDLPVALVQRAEDARIRFRLERRGLRVGRGHAAGVPGGGDQENPLGHRDHAVGGPHAGQCRDVRGDGGCSGGRRAVHRRTRCLGAADRRGMVWTAVGTAVLPPEGLRRDHAQDLPAGRAGDA